MAKKANYKIVAEGVETSKINILGVYLCLSKIPADWIEKEVFLSVFFEKRVAGGIFGITDELL
ncbi:MAG: hypothetical protein PWQ82_1491 [Thermosediminibacterales bacterium]|nr:hypothetical protein [Thermosediminibacterales bacterium]MDK2836897.1 hypothetical protein [Thermosediminibacterales bacterium]